MGLLSTHRHPRHESAPIFAKTKTKNGKLCDIDHIDVSFWEFFFCFFARCCLHFNYIVRDDFLAEKTTMAGSYETRRSIPFHQKNVFYAQNGNNKCIWVDANSGRRSRTKSILFGSSPSNVCIPYSVCRILFRLFFIFAFGPFIDLDLSASRMRQWEFAHRVRTAAGNLITIISVAFRKYIAETMRMKIKGRCAVTIRWHSTDATYVFALFSVSSRR